VSVCVRACAGVCVSLGVCARVSVCLCGGGGSMFSSEVVIASYF
jgi:hypothetical protein